MPDGTVAYCYLLFPAGLAYRSLLDLHRIWLGEVKVNDGVANFERLACSFLRFCGFTDDQRRMQMQLLAAYNHIQAVIE